MNELDAEHNRLMMEKAKQVYAFLTAIIPDSESYTAPNLALNVLTAVVSNIALKCVEEKDDELFCKVFSEGIKGNLDVNRKFFKENGLDG